MHPRYRHLLAVWAGLVVLALATFLISFKLKGLWSVSSSLAFAVAKASLVAWFFMHLSREEARSRLAFLIGVLFVVLLVSFALSDVLLRPHLPVRPPAP